MATISGIPLLEALPPSTLDTAVIAEQCRTTAATIIAGKGATSFGIGSVVSSICSAVLMDKHLVRPISHWVPELGCCLSLPVVLGRRGVTRTLPLRLSADENEALERSAETLRGVIRDVEKDFKVGGGKEGEKVEGAESAGGIR